jgi:hypothetical protein
VDRPSSRALQGVRLTSGSSWIRELPHSGSISRCWAQLRRRRRTRTRSRSAGRRVAELLRATPLPVYALGGLTRNDLEPAVAHGAHGIALRRAAWNAGT